MASKPSILYKFMWKQFVPDTRAYKPSAPLIETNCAIGVDVPLTHEFLWNSSEIIQAQITSGNVEVPEPILTPLGMRYCIDQFEQVMVNPDVSTDAESSDWDEGEEEAPKAPATKKETKSTADDEEWEEAPADTKTNEDKDWDETWEDA